MTDKEFKRLNRAQLIEIIYQLQLKVDELTEQNQALETALTDKRLRISNAGNLAEAALEINNCFITAQNAAEQYLNEIKILRDEAEAARNQAIAKVKEEAAVKVSPVEKPQSTHSAEIDSILDELGLSHLDNR